ncbi:energy-coupling factor transporter transmembrane component T [Miniphocaeibacter massiliensis]|uniref:energy-coupling factor transporter transmembrane component T n=1 Tax=Miniphocaeibacter massiliensis TaxID=2041841 RepID=UPI000C1C2FF2|nr:energy-coupling factor transporter transmembrane component T [Miniphocaeibacter massiliensis]
MNLFLDKLNPTTKIWIMIMLFIPITFSYDLVFTPINFVLLTIVIILLERNLSVPNLFFRLKGIILSSILLVIFLLITRGFGKEGEYQIFNIGISKMDIELVFSLGFRMITFAYITLIFIVTTDSVDLVLRLIHQWHFPYKVMLCFSSGVQICSNIWRGIRKN